MMQASFMLQVNATAEKIWPYYADTSLWSIWEEDLEQLTLENGFVTNGKGMMKLQGLPPMDFILTSVIENKEFWDKVVIPELGAISFGHDILEIDGQCFIKHTVVFEPEQGNIVKGNVDFIKQIFSDVPDSVWLLKQEAEKN